jgi:hypothetical protein
MSPVRQDATPQVPPLISQALRPAYAPALKLRAIASSQTGSLGGLMRFNGHNNAAASRAVKGTRPHRPAFPGLERAPEPPPVSGVGFSASLLGVDGSVGPRKGSSLGALGARSSSFAEQAGADRL